MWRINDINPRMNRSPHTAATTPTLSTNTISNGNGNPTHTTNAPARTTPKINRKKIVKGLINIFTLPD